MNDEGGQSDRLVLSQALKRYRSTIKALHTRHIDAATPPALPVITPVASSPLILEKLFPMY
jgi:hypothetical protein